MIKREGEKMSIKLEKMSEFFTARVNDYDEHMINNVEGCKEGYIKMAEFVPCNCITLLDLGCGTGLELEEIFKKYPDIQVTGIDLTKSMLDKLKEKYYDKDITLINASYLEYNLGFEKYDAAVSFQTMHHFKHEDKLKLYKNIYNSLKPGGVYIECDYMVIDQKDEDFYFNEMERLRREQNLNDNEFYHYDTPCTVDNQIKLFKKSGFEIVKQLWRVDNTTIIVSKKSEVDKSGYIV